MAKSSLDPPIKSSLGILLWPIVFGTLACDLLGLCHLVPTHSQHLSRPYMMSMVQFKVFGDCKNKND